MATTSEEVKALIKRFNALHVGRRNTWEAHWQEIGDHLIPRKSDITVRRTPGEKKQKQRFASVGIHSHEILSANLQGTLTSRAFRWFSLKLEEGDEAGEDKEVIDWLQLASRKMWRAMNASNFHSQSHEFYIDISGFGTGGMLCEELKGDKSFNGLVFTSYPIQAYVFEEDAEGHGNSMCIEINFTAAQAIERFGADKLPKKIVDADKKDPTHTWKFLHWIRPRASRKKDSPASTEMPWQSIYISVTGEKKLEESGYEEFPAFLPRWSKNAGEKYGRGPGSTALPDLKVLNKATELELQAWAKHIDPPWFMEDDGVVGKVNLNPGKGTTVRDKDALWFYEFRGRPDIGRIKLEELRQGIKQSFFVDQLELPQSDRMTAEEIRTRVELMQRVLGPTLGRLETEFLNPLIQRVFSIMLRAGALGEIPQALSDRTEIDVQYTGPLARAERQSEISSIQRLVETLVPLAQVDPTILDILDTDAVARFVSEQLDVDDSVLRDEAALTEARQARAQQQQQQQQAQLGLDTSKADLQAAQADAVRNPQA